MNRMIIEFISVNKEVTNSFTGWYWMITGALIEMFFGWEIWSLRVVKWLCYYQSN